MVNQNYGAPNLKRTEYALNESPGTTFAASLQRSGKSAGNQNSEDLTARRQRVRRPAHVRLYLAADLAVCFPSFQFDHDQVLSGIDGQQVDAPGGLRILLLTATAIFSKQLQTGLKLAKIAQQEAFEVVLKVQLGVKGILDCSVGRSEIIIGLMSEPLLRAVAMFPSCAFAQRRWSSEGEPVRPLCG
jgi:hypothetical protein